MFTKMYEVMAELPQAIGTTGAFIAILGMAFLFGSALLGITIRK